jgi:hypothetical protein
MLTDRVTMVLPNGAIGRIGLASKVPEDVPGSDYRWF